MSDAVRRAVRTLLQVLTAAVPGLAVLVAAGILDASQAAKAGAVLTVLASLVTAAWNSIEDRTDTAILVHK